METQTQKGGVPCPHWRHGSYLQGMETSHSGERFSGTKNRTDPTYKEWKPVLLTTVVASGGRCTDPTYKEWKHL